MLPGSPYGDVADFAARHAKEGPLVYVGGAEAAAVTAARMLHHRRLAGCFDRTQAVNPIWRPRSSTGQPPSHSVTLVVTVRTAARRLDSIDQHHEPRPRGAAGVTCALSWRV